MIDIAHGELIIAELLIKPYKERIQQLEKELADYKDINKETSRYNSPELDKLFTALSKAQGSYPSFAANRTQNYYKRRYVDQNAVFKAILPILSENGLSLIQDLKFGENGEVILHTVLGHSSGQWIESRSRIVTAKGDIFSFGSALATHKRFAATALLGLTFIDDPDDDDGVIAQKPINEQFVKGTDSGYVSNTRKEDKELIVKEQIEEIEYECGDFPDVLEEILRRLELTTLADLPKHKYNFVVNQVRQIVQYRKHGPQNSHQR